ncbi:MAG: response regulator [Candidatus Zixiibacteriota bacterium]|nr:MAG: response regulator [candidate division Zixibacteria bacterium]HHI02256.1 response regulator [candidate division Zixibacteria bacterium]
MAYNILVVDDSQTIRSIIVKILKLTKIEMGQIHEAENGREALDCLRDNWIDLILSDLNMPVMSGTELVSELAKDRLLKNIPVVVISTDGSVKRIEELKKKGIREYIRKPFTPESLSEVIDRVLGVNHG